MTLSRRAFLTLAGGAAAAAIAAPALERVGPLFIPADRLELGVPRARLWTPPASPTAAEIIQEFIRDRKQQVYDILGAWYAHYPAYGYVDPLPGSPDPVRFADLVDRSFEREIRAAMGQPLVLPDEWGVRLRTLPT